MSVSDDTDRLIAEAEALSAMIHMGEKISWGQDTAMIDRLIAALRAMQAEKRELALDVLAASGQAQEAYEAHLAAEAKLIAQVEAMRGEMRRAERIIANGQPDKIADAGAILRAALTTEKNDG